PRQGRRAAAWWGRDQGRARVGGNRCVGKRCQGRRGQRRNGDGQVDHRAGETGRRFHQGREAGGEARGARRQGCRQGGQAQGRGGRRRGRVAQGQEGETRRQGGARRGEARQEGQVRVIPRATRSARRRSSHREERALEWSQPRNSSSPISILRLSPR